ncbi:acyl-coenzyme A thioesterase THEM4 isoform X2 [Salminus brasiliensis]|uniref:acyl-coenzyme A thioesterase THEM4 isoform X2 n=1 Tax=Salminus brasiliensis TaxID=930266 RepID=UPI003B82FD19
MMRAGSRAVKALAGISRALPGQIQKARALRNSPSAFQNVRPLSVSLWPFSAQPRDFSLPNESWSPEMRKAYDQYNALCEVGSEGGEGETEGDEGETKGSEVKRGPWRKLPSYNRTLKYVKGGTYLSKMIQSQARLFTRSVKEQGSAFEYVVFLNKQEKRCVCVFQSGHLLEGPPGHVHGGAIATMIDSVTGTLAGYLSGPVMTANLNINYRNPIPLGSVVLIHSALDRVEGRKTFVTCRVTSTDESKLHTEATVLFLSVNLGNFFGA